LDPGAHRVVFQRTGSAAIAYELIVREGEKNRRVTAVFRPVVSRSATPPGEPARRPIPNGVWIATTLGALSLASFGAFGVLGLSTRAARHCDTGCSAADKSTVDLELRAADVSLGVAAVALGIGAVLFFTRPAANRAASMRGGPIEIVW
jgi:hypothetical protein